MIPGRKAVLLSSFIGGSVIVGRFVYKENQCNTSLPQHNIVIGNQNKKKAVVIGMSVRE